MVTWAGKGESILATDGLVKEMYCLMVSGRTSESAATSFPQLALPVDDLENAINLPLCAQNINLLITSILMYQFSDFFKKKKKKERKSVIDAILHVFV